MYERRRGGKKNGRRKKRRAVILAGLMLTIGISTASASMVLAAPEDPQVEAIGREQNREQNKLVQESRQPVPSATPENTPGQARKEPLVVIDAGHGGIDNGCAAGEVREKDINLSIAMMVAQELTQLGYQVELAREEDVYIDKEQRVEEANLLKADAYVSIHQNFCDIREVMGIETWYDGSDMTRDSRRLACLVHQETIRSTGAAEREVKSDPELCVTGKTEMSACLIETGFLSNQNECGQLVTEEYQRQIAEGIVKGIDLYFNPRTMYLTFDDGPSAESTDLVLDVLKERNIKATFFVIGEYVRKYPETAKRIVQEGHTIGIHCDVHDYDVLYESVDSYVADFEKAYETVEEVTGVKARLFRFPGGSVNAYNEAVCQDIVEEMTNRGFIYFDWNASLEDTVGNKDARQLIECARETTLERKKVVMLAHDRVPITAQCLGDLIDAFPEYRMKSLNPFIKPVQFVLPKQ